MEINNLLNITEKIINKENIDVVLYHGSCSDGFGSAFIIWYYYKCNYGLTRASAIKFIPCYYDKNDAMLSPELISECTLKNVIMCDFSFKYNQLVQIINISKSFIILDHHKTAEIDLNKIPDCLKIFDMFRSGTGITWDYFYPDKQIPDFLAYIQDRDLWTFKLNGTFEFTSFFNEQEFDFGKWEKFLDETNVQMAIEKGRNWLEYQNISINRIIKKASCVIQNVNNRYAIVLYCNSGELKSEIGNRLFKQYPIGDFSCVWDYDLYNDKSNYSLRSTNDRYDVSEIARKFSGGGHRNASGISFNGMIGCLPFERIGDHGILHLLLHCTTGTVMIGKMAETFTLFKVKEIKNEWMKEEYLSLIKRKCKSSSLIVFETKSDNVNITANHEIIPLKEYNMLYNEQSCVNQNNQLKMMATGSGYYAVTFISDKEFVNLFDDGNDSDDVKPDEIIDMDVDDSDELDSDYDNDSDDE